MLPGQSNGPAPALISGAIPNRPLRPAGNYV